MFQDKVTAQSVKAPLQVLVVCSLISLEHSKGNGFKYVSQKSSYCVSVTQWKMASPDVALNLAAPDTHC